MTQARSITQRRRRHERPTQTSGSKTAESILQNEFIRTRGNSTDCTTTEPEIMHPLDTSEFSVISWMPEQSCTNLAGGSDSIWVRIGQFWSYISSSGVTDARSRFAFQYASRVPTSRQYGSELGSDCTQDNGKGCAYAMPALVIFGIMSLPKSWLE